MRLSGNTIKNLIAGSLLGYGLVSFMCFIVLYISWTRIAPHQPIPTRGLIFRQNNSGDYTYFSAFQATACGLISSTSPFLAILGVFISPKKNITGTIRWYGTRFRWAQDDPLGIMKWAAIASGVATPFLVFGLGPHVIRAMNGSGLVIALG